MSEAESHRHRHRRHRAVAPSPAAAPSVPPVGLFSAEPSVPPAGFASAEPFVVPLSGLDPISRPKDSEPSADYASDVRSIASLTGRSIASSSARDDDDQASVASSLPSTSPWGQLALAAAARPPLRTAADLAADAEALENLRLVDDERQLRFEVQQVQEADLRRRGQAAAEEPTWENYRLRVEIFWRHMCCDESEEEVECCCGCCAYTALMCANFFGA